MKKLTGFVLIVLLTANVLHAQEKRDTVHYRSANEKKVKLKDELGLSKKQAKELKSSNKDFKEKAQQIKSDTTINRQEKRQMMKSLIKERNEKMDSVLTPDQRKKMKEMRKQRRNNKKENG